MPNGFQYAYTVSLYTHDSGSQVIDDSTIGGRWKTRLSESLPGWYLIFLVPVALVCLIYAGGIPYRAEHSQKPWPYAMSLEVQWLVPPELVISV